MFPVYNLKRPGANFIKAGETTRTFPVGQVCPFGLVLPPLPPGAVVDSEWVAWNYLLDGPAPPTDVLGTPPSVNGFVVTGGGFPVGSGMPDLCWGKDGAVAFDFSGLQNGSPDGLALVDESGAVWQLISYEGHFTAVDGPADGQVSVGNSCQ